MNINFLVGNSHKELSIHSEILHTKQNSATVEFIFTGLPYYGNNSLDTYVPKHTHSLLHSALPQSSHLKQWSLQMLVKCIFRNSSLQEEIVTFTTSLVTVKSKWSELMNAVHMAPLFIDVKVSGSPQSSRRTGLQVKRLKVTILQKSNSVSEDSHPF